MARYLIENLKFAGRVILNLLLAFVVAVVTFLLSWLLVLIAQWCGWDDNWFFQIINIFSGAGSVIMFVAYNVIGFWRFIRDEIEENKRRKINNFKNENKYAKEVNEND